jgi:hypothetical protein
MLYILIDQVVHNLIRYPYQPPEELRKRMIPFLVANPTKRFRRNEIDHLLKD